jgi:hypothetical protein
MSVIETEWGGWEGRIPAKIGQFFVDSLESHGEWRLDGSGDERVRW